MTFQEAIVAECFDAHLRTRTESVDHTLQPEAVHWSGDYTNDDGTFDLPSAVTKAEQLRRQWDAMRERS